MTKTRKSKKKSNPNIYVAKATTIRPAPRAIIVSTVKAILKEKQYKMVKKHVKKISIISTIKRSGFTVMGRWKANQEQVMVYDKASQPVEQYDHVARHEFAHAEFHYLLKYNPEAHANFIKVAMKHAPVSTYVRDHESKFRRQANMDSKPMYADEQHSEMAVRLADKMCLHQPIGELPEELVQAYRELHFL